MADFEITGGAQLRELGVKLRAADKQLRLKAARNLRAATRPVIKKQREAALSRLPKSGGLAALVAKSRIGTSVKTTGRTVAVSIVARNPDNIRNIDKGTVRHKTFGRLPWVDQAVTPGWFTEPAEEAKPEMAAALTEAIAETLKELS